MRSGLDAFSFRLVVFCQRRLAIISTLVLVKKNVLLWVFADLIEDVLDIVALFLVVWIGTVRVVPSALVADSESIEQATKTGVGLKIKPRRTLLTNRLQGPTRLLGERPRVASDDRKNLFLRFFRRVMFGEKAGFRPRPSLINSPSKPSSL